MAHLAIDRQQQDGSTRWPVPPPRVPQPVDVEALGRLEAVRAVLEGARAVLTRGWLQDGWYAVRPAARPRGVRQLLAGGSPHRDDITHACLVAAIAVSAHRPGSRIDVVGDAGPALDVAWEALEEARGGAGGGSPRGGGRAAPREVRVQRMRELARWNDTPGRTRDEVLAVVDRAISRTILAAVAPAR